MSDDLDLFRSASVLIKRFGASEAKALARKREEEFLEKGDIVAASAWRAIFSAIEEHGNVDSVGKVVH